ncbi:MAG: endonuclease/exonuclease/phosphatase family protein [Planctomycetota bacterium]|jgi:endonuclease/exonuclease/phosphatase family metal-dependent hydrolase
MRRFVPLVVVLLAACAVTDDAADADREPLTVMTFNIRYGTAPDGANHWEKRREMVFELLRRHDADLVGLQEVMAFQLDELAGALPSWGRLGISAREGGKGEHVTILYRRDRFEVLDHGTFWFSDTPDAPGSRHWGNGSPRICTWARLRDRRTGTPFRLYNVHLDHASQPSRLRSAELLRSRIAADEPATPVLVTGDFNALAGSPEMRVLLEDGPDGPLLRDTLPAARPAAEGGTFHAFRGTTDRGPIDFVLADDAWEVTAARIVRDERDGRYPSDHFPVSAVVRLRGPPPAGPR